jgi:hypothetical protein
MATRSRFAGAGTEPSSHQCLLASLRLIGLNPCSTELWIEKRKTVLSPRDILPGQPPRRPRHLSLAVHTPMAPVLTLQRGLYVHFVRVPRPRPPPLHDGSVKSPLVRRSFPRLYPGCQRCY